MQYKSQVTLLNKYFRNFKILSVEFENNAITFSYSFTTRDYVYSLCQMVQGANHTKEWMGDLKIC